MVQRHSHFYENKSSLTLAGYFMRVTDYYAWGAVFGASLCTLTSDNAPQRRETDAVESRKLIMHNRSHWTLDTLCSRLQCCRYTDVHAV